MNRWASGEDFLIKADERLLQLQGLRFLETTRHNRLEVRLEVRLERKGNQGGNLVVTRKSGEKPSVCDKNSALVVSFMCSSKVTASAACQRTS